MKKNLNINAVRNGKKVSKSIGFVNPDVANSLVGGFAQMLNALTNDTFVNAEVVKKMDTSEEDTSSSTPTPAPAKDDSVLEINDVHIGNVSDEQDTLHEDVYCIFYTYEGDGELSGVVTWDWEDTYNDVTRPHYQVLQKGDNAGEDVFFFNQYVDDDHNGDFHYGTNQKIYLFATATDDCNAAWIVREGNDEL